MPKSLFQPKSSRRSSPQSESQPKLLPNKPPIEQSFLSESNSASSCNPKSSTLTHPTPPSRPMIRMRIFILLRLNSRHFKRWKVIRTLRMTTICRAFKSRITEGLSSRTSTSIFSKKRSRSRSDTQRVANTITFDLANVYDPV